MAIWTAWSPEFWKSHRPRMTELRFKPHYRVAIHPPEHVFLLSEREHVVLRGRLYVAVAPYLKDGSDLSAIQAALADRVPADKVAYAIQRLRAAGQSAGRRPRSGRCER